MAAAQAADVEARVGQVHMADVLYEGFSRSMYDIQKSTGLGFGFAGVDTRRLNQILRHNWSGRMFSQRVWHNSNVTARTLAQALTECVMQGKTSRATFDELMEQAQGSRFAANRLLRTETNYISNQATAEAYEQAGIEKYRYMAVLDGRTSRICQEKDGNEYPLSEKEVGVNYPPLHPWCRSSVAPVIDGQNLAQMKRWARDPATGEEMKVPRDMSYKEWLEMMEGQHGKDRVQASVKAIRNRAADKRQYERYADIIGAKELPKTLEGFQNIKYNEPEKWHLLKGYVDGVRKVELSTVTGFEYYQEVAAKVKQELVGLTTSDGIEIKGFKTHFVNRVIGIYRDKEGNERKGVDIALAKETLLASTDFKDRINPDGTPSRHYKGDKCGVTINPDIGWLIQVNPR